MVSAARENSCWIATRASPRGVGSAAIPAFTLLTHSDGLLTLPYHEAKEAWVERFERAYVESALDKAGGNVSQAAREAQVDRRHLQRLMARYDIKKS